MHSAALRISVPVVVAAALLLAGSPRIASQQAVPPPPKPADSGPTLEATMQFIQQRLTDYGKVNYSSDYRDADGSSKRNLFVDEISQVGHAQCQLSLHEKVTRDGQVQLDRDFTLNMKDVEQIVNQPYDQYQSELNAELGHPEYLVTATNPAMVAVVLHLPHAGKFRFQFVDPTLADRMAKAFTHAAELCGGGNKDPF